MALLTGGGWIIIVLVLLLSTTTLSLGFGSSTAGVGKRRFTALIPITTPSSYRFSPKLHNINEWANGRHDGEGVRSSSHCNYFAAPLNDAETSQTLEENHHSSNLRAPANRLSFGIIAPNIRRDYHAVIITTAAAIRRSLLSIITRRTVATTKLLSILRPMLLSILVLLGGGIASSGNIPPAHASSLFGSGSGKSSQQSSTTTTKIYTPSSSSSVTVTNKIVKTIVTAGAVLAGVRTASKVRNTADDEDAKKSRGNGSSSSMTGNIGRALELDDDEEDGDDDDNVDVNAMNRHIANILAPTVVGEDMAPQPSSSSSSSSSSSNDPLSIAWIERELKESEEMRKKLKVEYNERMRKLSSS